MSVEKIGGHRKNEGREEGAPESSAEAKAAARVSSWAVKESEIEELGMGYKAIDKGDEDTIEI